MIDYFAIGLTHGLLALAVWRLLQRGDLDSDAGPASRPAKPWLKRRPDGQEEALEQAGGDA